MQTALQIMIVGEIVAINLITLHICCRPRKSAVLTAFGFLLSSVLIFVPGLFLLRCLPFYGNGSGLFTVFGFLYLIPSRFLYRNSSRSIVIILCAAWAYTLSIFSIAVQMVRSMPGIWFDFGALAVQTALFLGTAPFFLHFMQRFYRPMFDHTDYSTRRLLQWTGVLWFVTILLIHLTFVLGYHTSSGILCMTLLIINAIVAHFLLYRVVSSTQSLLSLQHEVYLDSLTGLRNRRSLLADLEHRILNQDPFALLYLDLDHFKYVNDSEGHLAGDQYLRRFSEVTSGILSREGSMMYRIAGDEFAAVYDGPNPSGIAKEIQTASADCTDFFPPFQGVSIGVARYPDCKTPEALLEQADRNMYEQKQLRLSRLL